MTNTIFRVSSLYKAFGSLKVINNVSISLSIGQIHGLIGPNGAGKTSLFNLITGELLPDFGSIFLNDCDISNTSADYRARSGIIRSFQRNNVFLNFTVRENLSIACFLKCRTSHVFWRRARSFSDIHVEVEENAEKFGLSEYLDRPAKTLAYGTQRQLELSLSIIQDPVILLLDEPTSGMSPQETQGFVDLVSMLRGTLTVLLVEHDMNVLFRLADSITVLDRGRVMFEGTPDEIAISQDVQDIYLSTRKL